MVPRARVSVWPGRRRVPGIVAPDSWGARGAECLPRDVLRRSSPATSPLTVLRRADVCAMERVRNHGSTPPRKQCTPGTSWGSRGFIAPPGQFRAGFSEQFIIIVGVEVIARRFGIVRELRRRGRPRREKMLCRVGKGRPAGSIELRVSPSPSKIPYGGFSPVRLQMDRQWRPSTTSRGLSAVHIRLMRPSYTPPQLQLRGIRDPRRDYPFENLSVQCGTTPNN